MVQDKRTRIHSHGVDRVLGMITPIYNREELLYGGLPLSSQRSESPGSPGSGDAAKGFDSHIRSLVFSIVLLALGTFIAVLGTIALYVTFRGFIGLSNGCGIPR